MLYFELKILYDVVTNKLVLSCIGNFIGDYRGITYVI